MTPTEQAAALCPDQPADVVLEARDEWDDEAVGELVGYMFGKWDKRDALDACDMEC